MAGLTHTWFWCVCSTLTDACCGGVEVRPECRTNILTSLAWAFVCLGTAERPCALPRPWQAGAGRTAASVTQLPHRQPGYSLSLVFTSSMSRFLIAVISSSNAAPGRAPASRNTRTPSRNAMMVGIDVISF